MGAKADAIRNAVYGKDVREAIAQGVEIAETHETGIENLEKNKLDKSTYNAQVINAGNSNAEIVDARGSKAKLKDRLDIVDSQLATIPNQTYITEKAKTVDVNNALALKADKTYVDGKVTTALSGTPKGTYATLVLLQSAHTTDDGNIYVVSANGHIYDWINGAWTDTGIQYQSTGISTNAITEKLIAPNAVTQIRTSFLGIGKNLLDLSTKSALGWWCNYTNGAFQSTEYVTAYYYSAPILVTSGQVISRLHGEDGTVFFDSNMVFISGVATSTFTVPNNAVFMVINFTNTHLDEQVEIGSSVTEREPYGYKLKSYVPKSIPTSALEDGNLLVESDIRKLRYHLNLPSKIYGVVGKEVNIYLDNLMIDSADKYNFNVECAVGIQQEERWTAIPTDAIETNLSIELYKDCGDLTERISNTISTLHVVPVTAGSGLNKKYLQIGDSTTWNMMNYGYLLGDFTGDAMALTQIGTQGTAPNLHEGYPGKDTEFIFSNNSCPLVHNGAFDFANYMTTKGYTDVDFVTLAMGINDMYGMQSDEQANTKIATAMAEYNFIINNIHAYNSNIKVGILLTIPPTKSQDAFGADGSNAQTQFRHKRNIMLWVKQCIESFSGMEASNTYIVPYATNLDTMHNFAYQSAQVNAHNPLVVNRQANALHPDYDGCWQMADSIYFWIKNMV